MLQNIKDYYYGFELSERRGFIAGLLISIALLLAFYVISDGFAYLPRCSMCGDLGIIWKVVWSSVAVGLCVIVYAMYRLPGKNGSQSK